MELRLANMNDLPQLKVMYGKIIEHMKQNNIFIWDDIYPCEFLQEDIEQKRFYLLVEDTMIIAAFALCSSNAGECHVKWKDAEGKALYIDRFAVNVDYVRQGMGSIMLKHGMELAKKKHADYLRLFAVDMNEPAIRLYRKNDFTQVDGIYEEKIDDNFILREYGFEIKV